MALENFQSQIISNFPVRHLLPSFPHNRNFLFGSPYKGFDETLFGSSNRGKVRRKKLKPCYKNLANPLCKPFGAWLKSNHLLQHFVKQKEIFLLSLFNPPADDITLISSLSERFLSIYCVVVQTSADLRTYKETAKTNQSSWVTYDFVSSDFYVENVREEVERKIGCRFDIVLIGPASTIIPRSRELVRNKNNSVIFSGSDLIALLDLCEPSGCMLYSSNTFPDTVIDVTKMELEIPNYFTEMVRLKEEICLFLRGIENVSSVSYEEFSLYSWYNVSDSFDGKDEHFELLERCIDCKYAFDGVGRKDVETKRLILEEFESLCVKAPTNFNSYEILKNPTFDSMKTLSAKVSLFFPIKGRLFLLSKQEVELLEKRRIDIDSCAKHNWTDKCWPEGKDGKFHNYGQENFERERKLWLSQSSAAATEVATRPMFAYDELVKQLQTPRSNVELSYPVHLPDLIDIYQDIWDQ